MKKYLLIRMMQTVAIILFAANVSAQNQNVVISVRNIPVRTTLTQIRQAANVHFVYAMTQTLDFTGFLGFFPLGIASAFLRRTSLYPFN